MDLLRSTPGLLSALQLRSVLCVIKACDKKVDEIFTGGHTYMSGDQLIRDFSAVRVVAGHIAKSIGEQFHDDVKLGLWEADLYKAVFNMETFVKHEAGTLTWQMAPYVPKNAYLTDIPSIRVVHAHLLDKPLVSLHIKLSYLVTVLKRLTTEYGALARKARDLDRLRMSSVRARLGLTQRACLFSQPSPFCLYLAQKKRGRCGMPVAKITFIASPGRVTIKCVSNKTVNFKCEPLDVD